MGEPATPLNADPADLERLEGAFLDAFNGDWDAIDEMVRIRLRDVSRLGDIVPRVAAMRAVVHELFDYCERTGQLKELIVGACRHTSDAALIALAEARGWAPGPPGSPGEAAASARTGLQALGVLLQKPEVHDALVRFRAAFEGADARIQKVGALKDLHDRLHDLQVRCYAPLVQAGRTFPASSSLRQLQFYAISLREKVDGFRTIARSEALSGQDFSWVEESLDACRVELGTAIEQRSSSSLTQALRLLRDVVQTQPTLIDRLLLQAVEYLDLPQLVTKLREVNERLASHRADAAQRRWVEKGTSDLGVLDETLRKARESHQAWQKVEFNVGLFEATLPQSHKEITQTWPLLKRTVERLPAVDDSRARELKEIAGLLDGAVQAEDRTAIAETFLHFQTIASDRFYQVDKDLKQLCERITPIGRELEAVVQQLQ